MNSDFAYIHVCDLISVTIIHVKVCSVTLSNVLCILCHLYIHAGDVSNQESHQPSQMLLSRVRSLPLEIQKVTSPRRLPCKYHWPPESHKIKRYWQCSYLTAAASKYSNSSKPEEELLLPLSKFIKEDEDKWRKLPSPKRYLLRGEEKSYHWKPINQLEEDRITESNFNMECRYQLMQCDPFFRNPNYSGHTEERKGFSDESNWDVEGTHKTDIKGFTDNINNKICSCEYDSYCSTNSIKEYQQQQQNIQNRPHLASIPQNTDHKTVNLEIREYERVEYGKEERNLDKADVVLVDNNNRMEMRTLPIKEMCGDQELPSGTESLDTVSHYGETGNIDLDTIEKEELITEMEENFITDVLSQDITVEDVSHSDKIRNKGNEKTKWKGWNIDVHVKNQKVTDEVRENIEKEQKESRNSNSIEERDKEIAIASIARYQLELHDPGKELSHMLENAIDFLKNLDKYAKTSSFNGIFLLPNEA